MVVNTYKHMGKVVVKILQGSAVTQTAIGGLTIYLPVANFLQCALCICQKLCTLAGSRQSYSKNKRVPVFLKHSVDVAVIYFYSNFRQY